MKTICVHCGEKFEKVNGTSTYCPDKNCYEEAKAVRQKITDDLIKQFRKSIYSNYKLLTRLLPSKGKTSIPVAEAQQLGFDEHGFYKSAKDNNNLIWHYCGPYLFSIGIRNGVNQLIIFKD